MKLDELREMETRIQSAIADNGDRLQKWADHTANLAASSVTVSDQRWEDLIRAHENLLKQAEDLQVCWEHVWDGGVA